MQGMFCATSADCQCNLDWTAKCCCSTCIRAAAACQLSPLHRRTGFTTVCRRTACTTCCQGSLEARTTPCPPNRGFTVKPSTKDAPRGNALMTAATSAHCGLMRAALVMQLSRAALLRPVARPRPALRPICARLVACAAAPDGEPCSGSAVARCIPEAVRSRSCGSQTCNVSAPRVAA